MRQNKPLFEIYEQIKNTIEEKIKTSELLGDVKSVVFGEQYRIGSLKSPTIWIVPEPHQPNIKGGATVEHDFTFDFVVLVKSPNSSEGLVKALKIAMTTYDVLMADRTLDGLVSDIRPLRVEPAYEAGNNTQLCWSAIQLAFRVERKE